MRFSFRKKGLGWWYRRPIGGGSKKATKMYANEFTCLVETISSGEADFHPETLLRRCLIKERLKIVRMKLAYSLDPKRLPGALSPGVLENESSNRGAEPASQFEASGLLTSSLLSHI
jgi:hypothetical protein